MYSENADESVEASSTQSLKDDKRLWYKKVLTDTRPFVHEIEDYCKDCVDWNEVRPIVNMLESIIPRDGPPELLASIKRIKNEFKKRLYGTKIHTKNLVMKRPYVNGPFNCFRNNKKVEVGKYGER